jgi:hypothetical protein
MHQARRQDMLAGPDVTRRLVRLVRRPDRLHKWTEGRAGRAPQDHLPSLRSISTATAISIVAPTAAAITAAGITPSAAEDNDPAQKNCRDDDDHHEHRGRCHARSVTGAYFDSVTSRSQAGFRVTATAAADRSWRVTRAGSTARITAGLAERLPATS